MRRPETTRPWVLPLIFAASLGCFPAHAQDTPQAKLDAIQKAIADSKKQQDDLTQKAAGLAAEAAQLRTQEIAAAKSVQAHEAALTRLDAQLATLTLEQKAKTAELARRQHDQETVLTSLLHLARNPPAGLALAEGAPVDLLRGGILMSAAVPPLIERASILGIELKTLADLQTQVRDAESGHRLEADGLARERARINTLAAEKAKLQQTASLGASQTGAQVQKLAAQASDLKDLIERAEAEARRREEEAKRRELEAQRRAAEQRKRQEDAEAAARLAASTALPATTEPSPTTAPPEVKASAPATAIRPPTSLGPSARPFAQARGRMLMPVSGNLVLDFGASDPRGGTSKGLTLETRPGAQVIAPFDGRVLFAGIFKGYGQILIIGHGDGYHSLVAGLDRIDAGVGQALAAGEPVGIMPSNGAGPRLYLELRHDGQPINPSPWLATRDAKVR